MSMKNNHVPYLLVKKKTRTKIRILLFSMNGIVSAALERCLGLQAEEASIPICVPSTRIFSRIRTLCKSAFELSLWHEGVM